MLLDFDREKQRLNNKRPYRCCSQEESVNEHGSGNRDDCHDKLTKNEVKVIMCITGLGAMIGLLMGWVIWGLD